MDKGDDIICDSCNKLFDAGYTHGICDTCERQWCRPCWDKVESFILDGTPKCDLCFITDPPDITDRKVLEIILKKTGILKQDIIKEIQDTHVMGQYTCSKCDDCCSSKCYRIGESSFEAVGPFEEVIRGLCCRARFKEETWCDQCARKKKIKT